MCQDNFQIFCNLSSNTVKSMQCIDLFRLIGQNYGMSDESENPDRETPGGYIDALRRACGRFRKDNRINQEQMGALIGASKSAVSAFENGESLLRSRPLQKLIDKVHAPLAFVARDLRNMADFIDSSAPEGVRKDSIEQWVNRYVYNSNRQIVPAIEERTKDGVSAGEGN
jgi:transcriptional regulator with XRE-family HTH domain